MRRRKELLEEMRRKKRQNELGIYSPQNALVQQPNPPSNVINPEKILQRAVKEEGEAKKLKEEDKQNRKKQRLTAAFKSSSKLQGIGQEMDSIMKSSEEDERRGEEHFNKRLEAGNIVSLPGVEHTTIANRHLRIKKDPPPSLKRNFHRPIFPKSIKRVVITPPTPLKPSIRHKQQHSSNGRRSSSSSSKMEEEDEEDEEIQKRYERRFRREVLRRRRLQGVNISKDSDLKIHKKEDEFILLEYIEKNPLLVGI